MYETLVNIMCCFPFRPGGYTVLALMMRGLGDRLAPDSDFMIWDNETNSSVVDTVSQDAKRVQVVVAVTLLSGLFQVNQTSKEE